MLDGMKRSSLRIGDVCTRGVSKIPIMQLYFFDWSAAQNPGAVLENLLACALQKFCDWTEDTIGRKIRLCYFRDRDGHKVDFLLVGGSRVHVVVEVKQSAGSCGF